MQKNDRRRANALEVRGGIPHQRPMVVAQKENPIRNTAKHKATARADELASVWLD